ncbi:MAG: hypothetical protein JNM17_22025 [Archangium sp.]|nr:hypothetical protein [Archangium sp.]
MTDLEAIELLQERARRFARGFHVATGLATLLGALALWCLFILVQFLFVPAAEVKLTLFVSFVVSIAVVPRFFSALLKNRLAGKRVEWIEELARTEGAKRDVLEASFTLDSW